MQEGAVLSSYAFPVMRSGRSYLPPLPMETKIHGKGAFRAGNIPLKRPPGNRTPECQTSQLPAASLTAHPARLSPHTSSSLQGMLECELAQGLPPLGRALGNKVGTMALWAHSQGELPPLRSTVTGSREAGTSQPPTSRARHPSMRDHQMWPKGGTAMCPMWMTWVGGIRKTCRKGPWGRVQNKTDNPASLGLSDQGAVNQGAPRPPTGSWTLSSHCGPRQWNTMLGWGHAVRCGAQGHKQSWDLGHIGVKEQHD